jgi:hypothetical protein
MTADGRKLLQRILKEQGKALKDVVIVQAIYGRTLLQGVHVDGGDGTALGGYLVDQLRSAGLLGPNEKPPVAEVGGKQVGVVEYGGSNVYLYSGSDTAWAVQGETEAAAAEALAALP